MEAWGVVSGACGGRCRIASLTEKQFDSVVGMLSKRAERVTTQGLRPRLSFDRVNDELIIMPGASKCADDE